MAITNRIRQYTRKEVPREHVDTIFGVVQGISRYANDFSNASDNPNKMPESSKYYEFQEIAGAVFMGAVPIAASA
jgi:hypothetical protein